jgi:hypothetical protein
MIGENEQAEMVKNFDRVYEFSTICQGSSAEKRASIFSQNLPF